MLLHGIPGTGRSKVGPLDNSKIRKGIKKANLSDAKSHFPHKVNLADIGCSTDDAQKWLMAHRYRSWKQKGLNGDYYYDNWSVLRFADKSVATEFVLSLSR
jgi:hypothetical protein